MGYGYQKRDFEIIDYQLWEMVDFHMVSRGPKPKSLEPGTFFTCLGGAQTFGCYAENPFPYLLSQKIGMDVWNAGCAGAGPLFFLRRKKIIRLANNSKFVIIQVMSGRSEDNSVFDSQMGRANLKNRKSNIILPAELAYQSLIQNATKKEIEELVEETRKNYVKHFIELLNLIKVPKILFWFSERGPEYLEGYESARHLFGIFPHLVNKEMIETIKPFSDIYQESISSEGLPQLLISRFTGEPVTVKNHMSTKNQKREKNQYYPSPEMHKHAFESLSDICAKILINQ